MGKTQTLGIYLLTLGVLQSILYLIWWQTGDKDLSLFYFDPRIGLFFFETAITGAEKDLPSLLRILSAIWLVCAGCYILWTNTGVKIYIILEFILGGTTALFMLSIAMANLGAAHGFSVGELVVPFTIFLIYTVAPLIIAFRSLKK